jgi:hypothetical protein
MYRLYMMYGLCRVLCVGWAMQRGGGGSTLASFLRRGGELREYAQSVSRDWPVFIYALCRKRC